MILMWFNTNMVVTLTRINYLIEKLLQTYEPSVSFAYWKKEGMLEESLGWIHSIWYVGRGDNIAPFRIIPFVKYAITLNFKKALTLTGGLFKFRGVKKLCFAPPESFLVLRGLSVQELKGHVRCVKKSKIGNFYLEWDWVVWNETRTYEQ